MGYELGGLGTMLGGAGYLAREGWAWWLGGAGDRARGARVEC